MRLDRFISSQKGDLSRSGVKELCRKGQVTVNGAVVKRPELQINEDSDSVCVCGEKIEYCRYIYIYNAQQACRLRLLHQRGRQLPFRAVAAAP